MSKDVVVALERQLCGEGPVPSGEVAQLLQDHRCFRLLLRSFELLGAEKAVSLSILRWVQGHLVGVWGLRSRCVGAGGDVGGTRCMFVGPGGAVLLHRGRGRCRCNPSTYASADWGVLGRRAMWGQSSTCLGAGGVSEVPGEPWLPVPVGCWPSQWGRDAGLPLAPLSVCPGLSGPPPSRRILNKFLDSYQEDVLPWHECVEPCLSSLSAHCSDREVRACRASAGPGVGEAGSLPAAARPCRGRHAERGGERLSRPWLRAGGWRAQCHARPGARGRCHGVGVEGMEHCSTPLLGPGGFPALAWPLTAACSAGGAGVRWLPAPPGHRQQGLHGGDVPCGHPRGSVQSPGQARRGPVAGASPARPGD